MTKQAIIEARQRAAEVVSKSLLAKREGIDRFFDCLLTKLLRPLFSLLPLETKLRLSRDPINGTTAAVIMATEIWGESGNVRVDGDECQVGTVLTNDDFVILGRGASWDEAFENAWRKSPQAC